MSFFLQQKPYRYGPGDVRSRIERVHGLRGEGGDKQLQRDCGSSKYLIFFTNPTT